MVPAAERRKPLVPADLTCWVITDGKAGDEVQCIGIAEALGLTPERRLVKPRPPWSWIAPYGPPDWRDRPSLQSSPIAPPFPDIAIASGRRTVPYLRSVKHASGGRTFTVFSKNPYRSLDLADVVCVPAHDRLQGDNVIATLTSPHRLTADRFAEARRAPDPRLSDLRGRRIGLLIGGPSGQYAFKAADADRLAAIAKQLLEEDCALMVTPSRRTPDFVRQTMAAALDGAVRTGRAFMWDGEGSNPYLAILALADAIVITGDSVNMIGEAAMSGAPIHIVESTGGHPKMTWFLDRMIESGAARRWAGHLETFTYEPINAMPQIVDGIADRFRRFRDRRGHDSAEFQMRTG